MSALDSPDGLASYPVEFDVEPQLSHRNRLSVLFRLILAIPHIIVVGAPSAAGVGGFRIVFAVLRLTGQLPRWAIFPGGNLLGLAVGVIVIISWFAIVFAGTQNRGMWDFTLMYMRWRANAYAYMALLRDEYPPFGDGEYPVLFNVDYWPQRERLSVAFRLILSIPHSAILFFLGIAAFWTTVLAWLAILVTGTYPRGLYVFNVGVLRWSMRFSAYSLLMVDDYPPYSLKP